MNYNIITPIGKQERDLRINEDLPSEKPERIGSISINRWGRGGGYNGFTRDKISLQDLKNKQVPTGQFILYIIK